MSREFIVEEQPETKIVAKKKGRKTIVEQKLELIEDVFETLRDRLLEMHVFVDPERNEESAEDSGYAMALEVFFDIIDEVEEEFEDEFDDTEDSD
jgi:hypothetical protein